MAQPTAPVVPYSSAIFSRASVEVMRGCTRGCRFCHAGTWYRPVRERKVDDVVRAGLRLLEDHETKVKALQDALIAGEQSGKPRPFDFEAFKVRKRAEYEGG